MSKELGKLVDQSDTSQKSDQGDDGNNQPFDAKNHFMGKLAAERGESSDDDQHSEADEDGEIEETSGQRDDADDEADDGDEKSNEESDADQDTDDGEDDQPDDDDEPQALTIDDRQYTAEDIKTLEKKTSDLEKGYRQSTQQMSEIRTQYTQDAQELETVASFFTNLTSANVAQLESMDISQMSPEEVQQWQIQLQSTRTGSAQVQKRIGELLKEVNKTREKMLDHSARESKAILESSEPRWNDEFYGKVRKFALSTGRYSAKEFADVTDWRIIEGLIAVMDSQTVTKVVDKGKSDKNAKTIEKSKPKRRRQNKRQRRNAQGKFQSAKQKVAESTNARGDGSLREYFTSKLAAERGGR